MRDHIVPNELLSSEDLVLRRKGEALVARMEHLYRTDEGFRRWYDKGFEQVASGQVVDVTVDVLRTENRLLREIVEQVFSHRMLCDVRACRSCDVPVIHMEQFRGKLDEAMALEDKARTLLGQDNEQWEEEE